MMFSRTLNRRRPARPVIFPDYSWQGGVETVIAPRPSRRAEVYRSAELFTTTWCFTLRFRTTWS
jgi:hypothetical protein